MVSTEIHAALVLIVFAGGPHTPNRLVLSRQWLETGGPAAVFLTGGDFHSPEYESLVLDTEEKGRLAPFPVYRDTCGTTLSSCVHMARTLRRRFSQGCEVVVVTSNYHAPRVQWLLGAVLPRRYPFSIVESRDIVPRDLLSNRTARSLILGEIMSWVYCLPAGLLLRPGVAALLALGAVFWGVRRWQPGRPAERKPGS